MLFRATFLDADECRALCAEMERAGRSPAKAFQGSAYGILPDVRRTNRVNIGSEWVELVCRRLDEWRPRLQDCFRLKLGVVQEPQFLAYSPGHFFRRHRDAAAGDQAPGVAVRRVLSAVVLLNPGAYEGGVLTLYDLAVPGTRTEMKSSPGELVAFASAVPHEVTPIEQGERFSIASWYENA